MSLRKTTLYEVDERLKVASKSRKNEAAGNTPPQFPPIRDLSGPPCGPPCVHTTAPGGLAQAYQPLRRRLCFRTGRRRACAIFEISDTRRQLLLAEEPGECVAIIKFQISERIGHVGGMAECNDPTRHGVSDFIDSGTDRRFDMFAALRIGKTFPVTPSLHRSPQYLKKRAVQERDN
jgi:hypothetical protein